MFYQGQTKSDYGYGFFFFLSTVRCSFNECQPKSSAFANWRFDLWTSFRNQFLTNSLINLYSVLTRILKLYLAALRDIVGL